MENQIEIYTDGSCLGNPGPGGWASVVIEDGKERWLSGGDPDTTNNRMEMMAVLSALKSLQVGISATIFTDSQYVVNAIKKGWLDGWKRNSWCLSNGGPVRNQDLWKEMDDLLKERTCTFQWVRGHNGNPYNEKCDKIAVGEAKKQQKTEHLPTLEENNHNDAPPQSASEARYTVDDAMFNLDILLTRISQNLCDGITRACAAFDWCDFCVDAQNEDHPCAVAYIEYNKKRSKIHYLWWEEGM